MKLIIGKCKLKNIYWEYFMYKSKIILLALFLSFVFAEYDYSLEDINSSSDYFGENVGTSYFPDQITVHYFHLT